MAHIYGSWRSGQIVKIRLWLATLIPATLENCQNLKVAANRILAEACSFLSAGDTG
jgi:hypothetical protein